MDSILIEKRPINVANILSEDRENLLIPSLGEYILLATPHKVFAMFLNSFMGEAWIPYYLDVFFDVIHNSINNETSSQLSLHHDFTHHRIWGKSYILYPKFRHYCTMKWSLIWLVQRLGTTIGIHRIVIFYEMGSYIYHQTIYNRN